jgi:NitT/TauT family transport system substrate-binding protein
MRRLLAIAAATLALLTTVLARPARSADVVISEYGVVASSLVWAVALHEGFFKKEGSIVTGYVSANGGGTAIRNMMANELPISEMSITAVIAGIQTGLPLRIIYSPARDPGDLVWVVKRDSPIKTIADLKGKKVGITSPRSTTEIILRIALQKAGILDSVEIIPAGSQGSATTALDVGAVDATPMAEPLISRNSAKFRVLFRSVDVTPRLVWECGVTTEDYAKTHGDELRRIILARRDAVDYIYAHPAEAEAIYMDAFQSDAKTAHIVVPLLIRLKYYGAGDIDSVGLDNMIRGMKLTGALDPPVDVLRYIDKEFLPANLR